MNLVLSLISEQQLKVDVCQIFRESPYLELLPKKSKSDSEIIFAQLLKDENVAMKIWFDSDEAIYRGLDYEAKAYEYITKEIIEKDISPNFIPFIAFAKCYVRDIITSLEEKMIKDDFIEELKEYLEEDSNAQLNILVTARKQNLITLRNFTEMSDKLPTEELASIVFQGLYSLMVMEHFQITHNDFHLRNIMVQVLDQPVCLNFMDTTTFKTKYILKIFDWDRCFIKSLGENPMLKRNNSIITHQINKFRKNQDYYQFICFLKDNVEIFHIINKILPNPQVYKVWGYGSTKPGLIKAFQYESEKFNKYLLDKKERVFKSFQSPHIVGVEIRKDKLKTFFNEEQIEILENNIGKEKFDNNYILYFIYSLKSKTIYTSSGWSCQSLYDVDESILYNLDDLFSNSVLFSLLTLYLSDKYCTDENKISYTLPFKIKESPVVLTDYTLTKYETYVDFSDDDE